MNDELKELRKECKKLKLEIIKLFRIDKIIDWLNLQIIKYIIQPNKVIPYKKISLTLNNGKKLSGYYVIDKKFEDKTNYILIYNLRNYVGKLINGKEITCLNKNSIAFYRIY